MGFPTIRRHQNGFTLAELLISMTILGVIATFTIPKVLSAQQGTTSNAAAKEAVAMLAGAYQLYLQNNTLTNTTSCGDLTPYMNYVKVETSAQMDDVNLNGMNSCSVSNKCLRLHSGAAIMYCDAGNNFGGTGTMNALFMQLDPDGRYGGATTGPSKSVLFWMYTSGRITTAGNILSNTVSADGTHNPYPGLDPSWFSW